MVGPNQQSNRILNFALVVTAVVGTMLMIIGAIALYRGVAGNVEIAFFGQSLKATNVGLSCLFLGATLVIVLVRRVLSSFDTSVVSNKTNSINDVFSSGQKKKETSNKSNTALPFYHMRPKDDMTLVNALSNGSEEQVSQLQHLIIDDPIYDVAIETAWSLVELPLSDIPEKSLFPIIERMFRRPAFYRHKERDWAYGLYALTATRIVWEQEVIPRLRSVHRVTAAKITTKLLDMEDLHAKVLGVSPEELTRCTSEHLWHKKIFDYFLPRKPYNFATLNADEEQRDDMLRELSELLQHLGLDVPEVGNYNVTVSPGKE